MSLDLVRRHASVNSADKTFAVYTQYGPITNGGITARPDAAICYRTILRVCWAMNYSFFVNFFQIHDNNCSKNRQDNNKTREMLQDYETAFSCAEPKNGRI